MLMHFSSLSGVHYSTNLMLFEQSLANLFDKGIQSTHNVPQLEKYVLEDMFWSGMWTDGHLV